MLLLVPAHLGSSGQRDIKWLCVCVCTQVLTVTVLLYYCYTACKNNYSDLSDCISLSQTLINRQTEET